MANRIPRVPVREKDPTVRATNFEEGCYGYNGEEAQLEASRCLHCKNPRCVAACPVSVKIPRVPVREQDPKVRATNFEEVCYGYNVEEAQLEASRCLNCKNPRCVGACPVSVKIPQFISEVAAGNFTRAAEIIAEDSSLPAVCGRVCPQETQCEGSCILGVKGEPVAIGKLERFVADWSRENGGVKPVVAPANGHKVAVFGSGIQQLML